MSEIILKMTGANPLAHVVRTKDYKYYYVSSRKTIDRGYETMVFKYKGKPVMTSEDLNAFSVNWAGEYQQHYGSEEEMTKGHYRACDHLEACLRLQKIRYQMVKRIMREIEEVGN